MIFIKKIAIFLLRAVYWKVLWEIKMVRFKNLHLEALFLRVH